MHTKCPACGAVNSLDSLICNDEASNAIMAMAELDPTLAKLVIRYCGFFRPAKTQLTFPRLAKLINELLPHITSQRLLFDKKLIDAPIEVWVHAFNHLFILREQNKLNTPLANHNYLFRIIEGYEAQPDVSVVSQNTATDNSRDTKVQPSAMEKGVANLQGLKRGGR